MAEQKISVWLDCDPGFDDLMAIIFCASHPRLNLIGVSTSPGNSTLPNTTRNALDILHNIGMSHIPVIKGSERAFTKCNFGSYIHGEDGICGIELPHSDKPAIEENSFSEIAKRICSNKDKVVFINTGSLTNLSILLHSHPHIKDNIKELSIMAGAVGKGNITPAAEFNVYFDPIAAMEVFNAGVPVTMVPLEVTEQAKLGPREIEERFSQYKSAFGQKVVELFERNFVNYKKWNGVETAFLHDPCAVLYVLHPECFTGRKAEIVIDTYPESFGRTNVYFKSKSPNAFVCETIDIPKFWEELMLAYDKAVPKI